MEVGRIRIWTYDLVHEKNLKIASSPEDIAI